MGLANFCRWLLGEQFPQDHHTEGQHCGGYDFSVPRFSETASTRWNISTALLPFDSGKMTPDNCYPTLPSISSSSSSLLSSSSSLLLLLLLFSWFRCYNFDLTSTAGGTSDATTSSLCFILLNIMSFDDILPSKRTIFIVRKETQDRRADEWTDMTFKRDVKSHLKR